jgi:four helix bundle protein
MAKIKSYRDLQVWQRSVDYSVMLYSVTDAFPQSELYGLTAQMRRASVSIASNIAEGFGRSGREFARFLQIALGSLAELETQIEIAYRVGYLSEADRGDLDRELTILGKQLNVLLQRVSAANQ